TVAELLGNVTGAVATALTDGLSEVSIHADVPLNVNLAELSVESLIYDLSLQQLLDLSGSLGIDLGPIQLVLNTLGALVDRLLPVGDLLQAAADNFLLRALLSPLTNLVDAVLGAIPTNIASVNATIDISLAPLLDGDASNDGTA